MDEPVRGVVVSLWSLWSQHGALRCNMARCVATWHAALLHAALRVQVYDQHLGAVNTITFIDDNRRWLSGFHSRPRGLTRARATLCAIARMSTQL